MSIVRKWIIVKSELEKNLLDDGTGCALEILRNNMLDYPQHPRPIRFRLQIKMAQNFVRMKKTKCWVQQFMTE